MWLADSLPRPRVRCLLQRCLMSAGREMAALALVATFPKGRGEGNVACKMMDSTHAAAGWASTVPFYTESCVGQMHWALEKSSGERCFAPYPRRFVSAIAATGKARLRYSEHDSVT